MTPNRRMRGFTLVEMMIAMLLGVIVVGAVGAFAVSSVRAYADNMNSSRMTRDLRTGMTLVVRELRRAGYDDKAVTRTLTSTTPTQFGAITVDAAKECVLYQYDRSFGGAAPTAADTRGIRRNPATNQLEFSSSSASCAGGTWLPVSDSKVLTVSKFTPKLIEQSYCQALNTVKNETTGKYTFTYGVGRVRLLELCLKGKSARDAGIERFVTDSVRIRAEAPQFITKIVDTEADAVCSNVDASGIYVNGALDTATTVPESPAQIAADCAK